MTFLTSLTFSETVTGKIGREKILIWSFIPTGTTQAIAIAMWQKRNTDLDLDFGYWDGDDFVIIGIGWAETENIERVTIGIPPGLVSEDVLIALTNVSGAATKYELNVQTTMPESLSRATALQFIGEFDLTEIENSSKRNFLKKAIELKKRLKK